MRIFFFFFLQCMPNLKIWQGWQFNLIVIHLHGMYLPQKDVCTGSHTSDSGPHNSMLYCFHRSGHPWHRSRLDRKRLCRHSILTGHMYWQIFCMVFQQLRSETQHMILNDDRTAIIFAYDTCEDVFSTKIINPSIQYNNTSFLLAVQV